MEWPGRCREHASVRGRPLAAATVLIGALWLGGNASQAAGDSTKGKPAFVRQCAVCHTTEKDGPNAYGPNLFGIVGKRAGVTPDFNYSRAFRTTATFEWTEGLLGPWISLPSVMVPGTTMGVFPGVSDRDKDDIIAYLATLK
jgi:cytochrome c